MSSITNKNDKETVSRFGGEKIEDITEKMALLCNNANLESDSQTKSFANFAENAKDDSEKDSKFKSHEVQPSVKFAINDLGDIQTSTAKALFFPTIPQNQLQRPNSAETRIESFSFPKAVARNISVESGTSTNTNKCSNKSMQKSSKFTPPDGGWGWVIVFASFMISLVADGISFSFGILFVDLTEYFKAGKSKTALVGSLFFSIPLLLGPLASALTDHYGCRKVTIISGFIASLGFIIGYFATSLEHLFIAFSVSGIGLSFSYVTSIVIVAYYFEKRRSLATGLAVCGTGIGTFIFPPLTIYLLNEFWWRGTLLIMAGFFLNIVVFGALMKDLDIDDDSTESSCDYDSDTPSLNNVAQAFNSHIDDDMDHKTNQLPYLNGAHHHSSLINIPTYIANRNGSVVPNEVLSEISARKDGYLRQLMQRYPNLLSAFLIKEEKIDAKAVPLPKANADNICKAQLRNDDILLKVPSLRSPDKKQTGNVVGNRLNFEPGAHYLRNMKLQRGSLTYRSAMLNIRRYRLRASSAPDIYRNSMVTINNSDPLNNFMHDVKDVLMDIVDFSIFKSFKYAMFCFSNLLLYACIDVPYVYLPDHAISTGSSDKETASFLISLIGMVNTLGIVIVGYFGDKPWLDAPILYSILITLGGISIALIPWVHSYVCLAILAAFYGFAISANYSLVSVILVNIISLDKLTNGYGLLLLVQGIASLLGPPIAGWLFDITGNYNATFYTTGLCILVSGVIVIPVANTNHCSIDKSSPSTPGDVKISNK